MHPIGCRMLFYVPMFRQRLRLSKLVIVEAVKKRYQFGEEVDVINLAE
jgi:hypothetical protein